MELDFLGSNPSSAPYCLCNLRQMRLICEIDIMHHGSLMVFNEVILKKGIHGILHIKKNDKIKLLNPICKNMGSDRSFRKAI